MTSNRSTGLIAALFCLLMLCGCAKPDPAEEGLGEQQSTPRIEAASSGAGATADSDGGAQAPGGPIGQGQGGVAPGGPIGDGSNGTKALASPIEIPAIQQNGQPVDDSVQYPGGVTGYVETYIRRQCPDGTLCGFTVTPVRHEPVTAPEASAVRDFCAFTPTEAQLNPVIVTHPVDIPLDCVWHYKDADTASPNLTAPETASPNLTTPETADTDLTTPDTTE